MSQQQDPLAPVTDGGAMERIEKSSVVRLPDGHEVVLGELPPGYIVEIASWQGLGEPTEETKRLVIGTTVIPTRDQGEIADHRTLEIEGASASDDVERIEPSGQESESVATSSSADLSSVARKTPFLGGREFAVSIPQSKESRGILKSGAIFVAQLIGVVITALLLTFVTLEVTSVDAVVPTAGPRSVFGATTDSIVFYREGSEFSDGDLLVSIVEDGDGGETIRFGAATTFDEELLQIETVAGQELVPVESVVGRGFLILPYLGGLIDALQS